MTLDILVVIVLFKKKISNLFFLSSTSRYEKIIEVFIYDNSPFQQSIPNITGYNLIYTHDPRNPGISYAYNQAILLAKKLNKKALIFLDQDTEFHPIFIEKYCNSYRKFGDEYIYAPIMYNSTNQKIYSPALSKGFVGKALNSEIFIFKEKYKIDNISLINSGLMVPISIFNLIGGYNDKIKLDFSDYYFIEKYKLSKKEVILINLYIQHSLSGDEGKNFFQEKIRYEYYYQGAIELENSLGISMIWPVLRRFLRLSIKYSTLKFLPLFVKYFKLK